VTKTRVITENIFHVFRFCRTIVHRLPSLAFDSSKESGNLTWLENLYNTCHEVLMTRNVPSEGLDPSIYTEICDILAPCIRARAQLGANLKGPEESMWRGINRLLVQTDLVSDEKDRID
jgi:hypothetical protein